MAIPIDLSQSKRINALIRKLCCNCDNGNCLILDDGNEHPCVQLISKFGIYCNYFKYAVLPADKALCAEVMNKVSGKPCSLCGTRFIPKAKKSKILPQMRRTAEASQSSRAAAQKTGCPVTLLKLIFPLKYKAFQNRNKEGNRITPYPLKLGLISVTEIYERRKTIEQILHSYRSNTVCVL